MYRDMYIFFIFENCISDENEDKRMGKYLDFLDPERERDRELDEDLVLELEPV